MTRFIAFDVETPNMNNNRICAIGVSVINDGQIAYEFSTLVNPECRFDFRNTAIHGISPDMVRSSPAFPEIWHEHRELFLSGILVAHNASFDLNVLRKTLQFYGIFEPMVNYLCTLWMSKAFFPEIGKYNLPTLCNHFGIDLDHHNVLSDTCACARLACMMVQDASRITSLIGSFNLSEAVDISSRDYMNRISDEKQALRDLNQMLREITSDGILSEYEVTTLQHWVDGNLHLAGNYPYDRVLSAIHEVMQDSILEPHELDWLLQIFRELANPVSGGQPKICSSVAGKIICLSGDFKIGSKEETGRLLERHGAAICASVTKRTDLLVVGSLGSGMWYAGNYGTKVKKAKEMQDKGDDILILDEDDVMKMLRGDIRG